MYFHLTAKGNNSDRLNGYNLNSTEELSHKQARQ
jgi:hypothetical protein